MLDKIQIDGECKCGCGDMAILEDVYVLASGEKGIYKLGVKYWCYHRCDSVFTKTIKIEIK